MLHKKTVLSEGERPLITFALLAYNQEQFIREAVEGALSQTYSPLEIILSDDCSTDRTFEIMTAMVKAYEGPHKIVLNKNKENLGIGRHYNKVMDMASGEIIELAAGDDISLPERTNISWDILRDNPDVMSVSLGLRRFKGAAPEGLLQEFESKNIIKYDISNFILNSGFHLNAPARAFRKHTHTFFGPLNDECPVEDSPNLLRSLLHGKVAQYDVLAVLYRIHNDNYYASENKYTIDYKGIFSNNYSDIDKALKLNLIDKNIASKCIKAICQREQKEVIKVKFYHSQNKLIIFLYYILFSKKFSGNAKLKYIQLVFESKPKMQKIANGLWSVLIRFRSIVKGK